MTGIGETSTSYPYLALARRRGIDYGAVLHYAQFLYHVFARPATNDEWEQFRDLTTEDRREVREEFDKEMTRRRERA